MFYEMLGVLGVFLGNLRRAFTDDYMEKMPLERGSTNPQKVEKLKSRIPTELEFKCVLWPITLPENILKNARMSPPKKKGP